MTVDVFVVVTFAVVVLVAVFVTLLVTVTATGAVVVPVVELADPPDVFDVLPDPSQTNSLIKVTEKLTSFIGQANKSNLRLPDSNVKLGLNAAIKLAGTKLSTLKSAGTVDRSAIVFIGNGPFDSSCSADTPEKAAQDAFAGVAKARTYAVLTAGTSKAQADSLAAAGQGKGYDGTGSSGAASALQAFADISASLTTCRYVDASPSSTAAIEYYNPITLKTVTVANNQACNAGSGAGWHRDGSVIEFCKESCDALQDAYKKSLALSASNGSAPPALPVYFRAAK